MTPRVASLVPSATEILAAIGGGPLLVGRSHECDYPASLEGVRVLTSQKISGRDPAEIDRQVRGQLASGQSLYTLDRELLRELRPDVILTQDLCSVCSIDLRTVEAMTAEWDHPPAIVSLNPASLDDVLDSMLKIGEAVGLAGPATELVVRTRERFYAASEFVNPYDDGPSVAFLEWTDPLFIGGHWIPQMIERAGGRHPLNPTIPAADAGTASGPQQASRRAGKSVRIDPSVLAALDPDAVVIAPCGVPLSGALDMARNLSNDARFSPLKAIRAGRVAVVDGNQMFSRPGPRLADAFEWLVGWIHGRAELMPPDFPWSPLGRP